MSPLKASLADLIQTIKEHPDYQEYRRLEETLKQETELKQRVDEYRRRRYLLQNEDDVYEAVDHLEREYRDLFRQPKVREYLDAEVAVCRLVQYVLREIHESIEIDVPQ